MSIGNSFNKLWIIESLGENDQKTGTYLYENQIAAAQNKCPELLAELVSPESKNELLEVFKAIERDIRKNGNIPIIHLELHGNEDGLAVSNGEFVQWGDLRDILISINLLSHLNLLVVIAACKGAYMLHVCEQLDKAPFWAIIGSDEIVYAPEIEVDFGIFYQTFFETLSGDEAIKALNNGVERGDRKYHFVSIEGFFIRTYAKFYNENCKGKGKKERLENILTEAMNIPEVKAKGINWARKVAKQKLEQQDKEFYRIRDSFFFRRITVSGG